MFKVNNKDSRHLEYAIHIRINMTLVHSSYEPIDLYLYRNKNAQWLTQVSRRAGIEACVWGIPVFEKEVS